MTVVYILEMLDQNLLYMDDMLLASNDRLELDTLKERLNSEFEIKDLGPANKILGIDIKGTGKPRSRSCLKKPM